MNARSFQLVLSTLAATTVLAAGAAVTPVAALAAPVTVVPTAPTAPPVSIPGGVKPAPQQAPASVPKKKKKKCRWWQSRC
jgi:hypothetical protein